MLESNDRGVRQSAWRIQVASSPALLASGRPDLWDSGRVVSGESVLSEYRGRDLKCGQYAWWKVRVWDGKGRPVKWSKQAFWSKGPSSPSDWKAKWITSASRETRLPLFRREFAVSRQIERATVFVCGLGHYELRLNGQKVGDRELDPGWTNYRKTCLYSTYDVTPLVHRGANALGVLLGNGMYHVPGERYTKFTGSFGAPKLILQMEIEYPGGARETIASGASWRAAPGPMTLSSVFGGEDWDARLEEKGWDRPGFPMGANWRPASVTDGPGGALRAQMIEPVVVQKTLKPVSWKQVGDRWIADFGQNMSGWPRLRVRGRSGQVVRLVPGEMLKDGLVDQSQSGGPSYWQYTLRGSPPPLSGEGWGGVRSAMTSPQPPPERRGSMRPVSSSDGRGGVGSAMTSPQPPPERRGSMRPVSSSDGRGGVGSSETSPQPPPERRGSVGRVPSGEGRGGVGPPETSPQPPPERRGSSAEDWRPRFSYYGFRWVQIEGAAPSGRAAPGQAVIEDMGAEVLYPDVREAGTFECSDPLINRIHDPIKWAIVSNMKSVLTDCPHREKLGWLEQAHLCGPSLMYNYGLSALYAKIAADMREAQTPNGLVPDIAPEYVVFQGGFRDSPEWGSAYIIALWQHYQFTGDLRSLEENYEGMRRYLAYLTRMAKGGILSHGLGDWADVGPNPPGSHNTPMGVTATATFHYDLLLMSEIAALLGRHVEAEGFRRQADDVRQAFNRRFLHPETNQYASGSQAANGMALFCGIVDPDRVPSVRANLVKDVADRGFHTTAGDVGHRFVLQPLADAGRSDVVLKMMQQTDYPSYGHQLALGATALTEAWDGPARGWSQNHFMLGHAEEWFYKSVLGIDQEPGSAGWRKILIRPAVDCGLAWARGSYESPRGRIGVNWRREGGQVTIRVTIPVNATAIVRMPAADPREAEVSGLPSGQSPGVRAAGTEDRAAVFAVGSGSYTFTSRL